MKKICKLLVLFITIFSFNLKVNAASATFTTSASSVQVGDTFYVYVNVFSTAAWNVHVTHSDNVSGCFINEADASADGLNLNRTFTASCVASSEGTITLTLSGDICSEDGNVTNLGDTKYINVTKKVSNNNNNNNNNNNYTDTRSTNNNLKELKVKDYEVTKVDNNNYTLTVDNDVASINVSALAEDDKAIVTGDGDHSLNIGDNNIEIVVTAENGSQNKINLVVTRKDGYGLEDLENLLTNSKDKTINIKLTKDSTITNVLINKIKASNRKVIFNCYDNDKLVYSYVVDGNKLKSTNALKTLITESSDNSKKISKLSNYADGVYLTFKQKLELPSGVSVRYYVNDKYSNKDKVNVYYYDNNTLTLVNKSVIVKDGYVEFDFTKGSDYFITQSNIDLGEDVKESSSLPIIIIIILLLVIVGLILFLFKKNKNNKKNVEEINKSEEDKNTNSINNIDTIVNPIPVNTVPVTPVPSTSNVTVNKPVTPSTVSTSSVVTPNSTVKPNTVSAQSNVVTPHPVNNTSTTNNTVSPEVKINLKQSTNPNINPNLGVKPVFKQNN
jgi:hypothetical protein